MRSAPERLLLALWLCLAPFAAAAQSAKTLGPEDVVQAYQQAQISRSAVRDQLDLCAEDADKLNQIFTSLRPDGMAERGEWLDWANLYRGLGTELHSCLRSYAKQIVLHRRDVALLRERLPLLKEPKRLTVSPKLVSEIHAYVGGLDKELTGYAGRARAMANSAELATGRAMTLLREAGIAQVDMPSGFGDGF